MKKIQITSGGIFLTHTVCSTWRHPLLVVNERDKLIVSPVITAEGISQLKRRNIILTLPESILNTVPSGLFDEMGTVASTEVRRV